MKITWAFDVVSPFSYLSLKQLPRLPAGVEIERLPILFAGLLNHHGQVGNAEIESKRLFTYRFCVWRARQMGVEMRFPPSHPFNPLMALRLIIAAGSTPHAVETVFDAAWRYGLDLSDPGVIADLARQLNIEDSQRAMSDPAVKQKLHDNTARAIQNGLFGVPSFVVGKDVFWGHDAFEMVLDYLRHPKLFEDPQMQRIETLPVGIVRSRRN